MTVLEVQVRELRERVERLEARQGWLTTGEWSAEPSMSPDQEQLRAARVVMDPPTVLREQAAVWQALPENERQAVSRGLDNLPAGSMASDIIIDGRHISLLGYAAISTVLAGPLRVTTSWLSTLRPRMISSPSAPATTRTAPSQ